MITVPHRTDSSGRFLSYTLHDITPKVFISIRWQSETLRLVLERHDIVPATSTAEWTDSGNVTNAEQLHSEGEQFYQGRVRSSRFSFVAVSINEGLVSFVRKEFSKLMYFQLYNVL